MILRPYQEQAENAMGRALANGIKKPLVCLPTGSGKSLVIASLIHKVSQRFPNEQFTCVVHTQELVGQLAATYRNLSGIEPSIYSASLKRKELGRVVFGQIQSVYRKACDFGRIKLLVVDECDRMPVEGDGQYRTFIKEASVINPDLRVCGFTATPYRMRSGLVYGKGQPFDELVYDADIRSLIESGYLSKLISKDGGRPDLTGVAIRNGDYAQDQLENKMSDESTVAHAVDEIIKYGSNRKAWIIFASGLKHASLLQSEFLKRNIDAPIIEGNTPDNVRKDIIAKFRNRELLALININVLSVGFDAPHIDLLCLLRPTLSPGLYYQQVGRGLRTYPGKEDCLVLDLAGNIYKHGPIDTLNQRITAKKSAKEKGDAPTKTCPECSEILPIGARVCSCGFEFPPPKIAKHSTEASNQSPLTTISEDTITKVMYRVHPGRDGKPNTICVIYRIGLMEVAKEYLSVDINANTYARGKTLAWLLDTPKINVNNRLLSISSGTIMGHTTDGDIEIKCAEDMLPFCECLVAPTRIKTRPNAKIPKHKDVLSRVFVPSNDVGSS